MIVKKINILKGFILSLSLILLAGVPQTAEAQISGDENVWKTLAKVSYEKKYDEFLGFDVDMPVFSESTKALDGKRVVVKGYIIPVEGYKGHTEFVFSAYPYNMCFFCGGAGPETVMEVTSVEPIEYTAEMIAIEGKLELNPDDINRLMYIMTEAKQVN